MKSKHPSWDSTKLPPKNVEEEDDEAADEVPELGAGGGGEAEGGGGGGGRFGAADIAELAKLTCWSMPVMCGKEGGWSPTLVGVSTCFFLFGGRPPVLSNPV